MIRKLWSYIKHIQLYSIPIGVFCNTILLHKQPPVHNVCFFHCSVFRGYYCSGNEILCVVGTWLPGACHAYHQQREHRYRPCWTWAATTQTAGGVRERQRVAQAWGEKPRKIQHWLSLPIHDILIKKIKECKCSIFPYFAPILKPHY